MINSLIDINLKGMMPVAVDIDYHGYRFKYGRGYDCYFCGGCTPHFKATLELVRPGAKLVITACLNCCLQRNIQQGMKLQGHSPDVIIFDEQIALPRNENHG